MGGTSLSYYKMSDKIRLPVKLVLRLFGDLEIAYTYDEIANFAKPAKRGVSHVFVVLVWLSPSPRLRTVAWLRETPRGHKIGTLYEASPRPSPKEREVYCRGMISTFDIQLVLQTRTSSRLPSFHPSSDCCVNMRYFTRVTSPLNSRI